MPLQYKFLDESSLSRVWQHVSQHKVPTWGMLTAFRSSNTRAENLKLNKQLAADLRDKGYGFFKVEGHWLECQDDTIPYDKCPTDKLVDATEESLFVPGISKSDIHMLGKKYGQDSVLYGDKKHGDKAQLIFSKGGTLNLGSFNVNKVQQAYSKFKSGKSFAFDTDEKPKTDTSSKLKDAIPSDILDKIIKNPRTGRNIKVKTALGYKNDDAAHKMAVSLIKNKK